MSFRQRTSRFGGTQTEQIPEQLPFGFGTISAQVTRRSPTVTRTVSRTTTRRRTPTRIRTRTRRVSKAERISRLPKRLQKLPTRTPRPTVSVDVDLPRTTPIRRKPTKRPTPVFRERQPPRDDIQRSLDPLPVIRPAFAETFPERVGEGAREFLGVDPSRVPPPRTPVREPELGAPPFRAPIEAPEPPRLRQPREPKGRARTVFTAPRDDIERSLDPLPSFVPVAQAQEPTGDVVLAPPRTRPQTVTLTTGEEVPIGVASQFDPRTLLTVESQREFGLDPPSRFAEDPTLNRVLGGIDTFTRGISSFERQEFEGRLQRGEVVGLPPIDPRSTVGRGVTGVTEFAVGFSEELLAQAGGVINLGSFVGEETQRRGFFGEPIEPARRRDVTVPRTVTGEFVGGAVQTAIEGGEDPFGVGRQRAEERFAQLSEARGTGQLGGFLIPLAVGGASLATAAIKAPRAFLPQTSVQAVPVFAPRTGAVGGRAIGLGLAEVTETVPVARALTIFGRPIVSRTPQGFVRGAPSASDLAPQVRALGSTLRQAEGLAEGGKFQQKINFRVVDDLVARRKLDPTQAQFLKDQARVIKVANSAPVNVLRGFGDKPVGKLTKAENKALIKYFRNNSDLQVKGSFSFFPQIRKAGLREIGDIDVDLSKFGDASVALSKQKAAELTKALNEASKGQRTFVQGTGKQVGKIFIKEKGKQRQAKQIVEFLNKNDAEEGLLDKTNIVFDTKPTRGGVKVEGLNLVKLTESFRRKTASINFLQKQGTRGVPDDPDFLFRLGATSGRFEKDAVDAYQIGKTLVETLRGLNRVDRFKQSLKLKGVTKSQIDDLESVIDDIPKKFPKNAKGEKINYNNPSNTVREVIDFTKTSPIRSVGRSVTSATSRASKASGAGSFSRLLESTFSGFSKPSKPSRPSAISPAPSPSIFSSSLFEPSPSAPSPPPSAPSPFSPFGSPPSPPPPSPPPSPFPTSPPPSPFPPSSPFPSPSGVSPPPSPPPPPPPPPSGAGGVLGGFGFPLGGIRTGTGRARRRRSGLGRRLFDIADEPFGAITVGLGFFAEQETGRETIEELIGRGDEPLTRQERQARARLGRGGRRRQQNFAEGFDFSGFFS